MLELRTGHWELPDAAGETEIVERLLMPRAVIRAGRVRAIQPPASGLQAAERGR